jgi:di/tricarboxylate transporter
MIPARSSAAAMLGSSLHESGFRQRYNAVVLAIHRDGRNLPGDLQAAALEAGDPLLVVTPSFNLAEHLDMDTRIRSLPAAPRSRTTMGREVQADRGLVPEKRKQLII